MSRARRTLAAAVTLAVASTTLTGCLEEASPHEAVRDFLVGWQSNDYELAASRADGDPAAVRKALADAKLQLDAASFRFRIKSLTVTGEESRAEFGVEVDLGDNNPLWTYDSVLPLHLHDGAWKVKWSPSVLHPQLKEGQRFAVKAEPKPRQPVVDRGGDPLQQDTFLYVARVVPARLGDRAEEVVKQLSQITGYAEDRLLSRIRSAPPNETVPLITFGRTRYQSVKPQLDALPEVETVTEKQPVDPADPKQIVGRVSALTPETEQKLGGPQRAGDSIGQSGLQQAYQGYLTGSTETEVIILDLRSGDEVASLQQWPGRQNRSVQTTIDSGVQAAAERAVSSTRTGAVVAVDRTTGEIRAVATRGLHQEKDALAGKFPAGTAFSVVAADALLRAGVRTGQRLPCPAERTVGGARFVNVGQATGSSPTFQENFAQGCVTALASLARRVSGDDLAKSAKTFGIGESWRLPLKSFSGSLPAFGSDADRARTIAGQNVQVSPLSMALVAAAVASGTWRPPVLVTDPDAPDTAAAEVTPAPQPRPQQLDPQVRKTLTAMMRAGAQGTPAQAGSGRVHGVASAPTGKDNNAWFVGWQGDLAISVYTRAYDPAAVAGSFFAAVGDSP
ncbi:penicillin-binding transpeptidase domain-containing protein [Nonomuraea sp. MCN248]|uniref:Penicillin-binding transpeptidase domain-containing protein n=1 Tax=Nonomuraea corallina TaxID=2989783 RepID=A0ABT4S6N8_9ACTN|nr:penicillin-binding transpeptidase domain-containing protein [Nonomuraea corallina]MDA0632864.1 penicillin-binding transpeptidase domain-containing protein [Nonomuraea corallina]